MNPRRGFSGAGWAAAFASLALAACQRNADIATTMPPATVASSDSVPAETASPDTLIANNPTAAINPAAARLSGFDETFAIKAAEGALFEVEAGKLALDKASDPALKDFARKLVEQHGAANDRLRRIATSQNLALPASLPDDKRKQLDDLARLSGAAFEREFVRLVGRSDHAAGIALFEQASREAVNPDLREFASAALPTLHEHLATARRLPAKS
jgi:putative membrane protein